MDADQHLKEHIETGLTAARAASRRLAQLDDGDAVAILHELAGRTLDNMPALLDANARDLARMDPGDPKYDRLLLDENRLRAIAADLRAVAALPSPLHRVLEERTRPNGLALQKISVPIGVLGIVYESRPNVTFDVFALALKSGNACVLKGSRDAHDSNTAIAGLIDTCLAPRGLSGACWLAPSERAALGMILQADRHIDAIIPRGSQGLIDHVRAHSRVPVIETGAGIVHTYFDASADLEKGKKVVENAKARRVSVCNALDTLIVHAKRLGDLPALLRALGEKHRCTVFADPQALEALKGHYPPELLHPAREEHYGTEFLSMKMSVRTVDDLDAALEHIARYSSKHSEAILAEDSATTERFLRAVDAAVVYANASTAFTDGGEFGFGAEIGISTQKLHARGPMALPELTSYKWVVRGEGQVR
ncbi:MAG: glutamate-5-semialdehyde dehydrogenase [Saprospiraceae bacterium]|nr:glutamate-5-semialdehyde dehydrogenase [Saprospiraceae bacterium]MCB0573816.1 glutamate-5-semialdehyde dehydrogenase [Saprospiraceae bacterium]MCB9308177.1 glutamate-5-semialdehyde dehydrogenase [Lewinellaceae bacterium]MCB9354179.1 glutamate-5-semialdehyde dehydrogenase [Lewinellaceae bacterium]